MIERIPKLSCDNALGPSSAAWFQLLIRSSDELHPMKCRVVIEQDEDGMVVVETPALPGCISQGATYDEALRNINEAIAAYLESLQRHGEPIPLSAAEE